ncbi:putative UDP-N-acetyl-D-mannosaminuronic acid transferase [Hyphomicrobium sulfonivorans]|uniref:Putative UDP-N-acetyl-D-mannosaminuronic acid transferase n=1 Tax=Hyphomicrobium sulfonivorans TaxID=121290 RepID=A0A109BLQ9_HYPSL|nr:WecB/TagA/CpsF family glycosyltransferase [Hyphomicrobium sulfonivorans]KWT70996.1 putative UDP-N-acetyl-D-mannosaminuronic acid transferase [Hyphomicrobium sulfonivorans]
MENAQRVDEVRIDGWRVNVPTQAAAIDLVSEAMQKAQNCTVFTLNLDHLVKLREDAKFRDAYQQATFVTADGAPVVRIGRRTWPELERTTGADLMLPLSVAAAEAGQPVFLFGSSDEVLARTRQVLAEATGGKLNIVGAVSPPRGFDPEGELADQYIDDIRRSGARLCFVLLGAPKQELFSVRAAQAGAGCSFICVGAAADFLAGLAVRAPEFVQRLGLEWFWRLAQEPRRLGPRYAKCALLLARLELRRLTGAGTAAQTPG